MRRRLSPTIAAGAAYLALAVVMTWPLARGLGRDLPADFGDPLLNTWILAWDAGHFGNFNAPIFAPHPLALAYSDHLTPQAILVWPVYALTGNPILGYNLLFLATFAVSAFAMFLLARELTGSAGAAFLAGVAFGFAPYRFSTLPHVQVLSSMWMPLVLLQFRRFFSTGRTVDAATAAAAWAAQALASGYYLLFFSPIVGIYLAWELANRRAWSDRRTLVRLAGAVVAVAAIVAPFLIPYLKLRRLGFNPRSSVETQKYAADVYAYVTADPNLRLWGGVMRAWPHAEGALFPGVTIVALALVALVVTWRRASDQAPRVPSSTARLAGAAFGACSVVTAMLLLGWSMRGVIKITSLDRLLLLTAASGLVWLYVSRSLRQQLQRALESPVAAFAAMTLAAIVMSFGPAIHARGRIVEPASLYGLFYRFVPGYDGLRVPARFGMIVAFGLAALAGFGIAFVARTRSRVVAIATALVLIESFAAPIPLNQVDANYAQHGLRPLPPRVFVGAATPAVYQYVRTLPRSDVLLELPLGEPAFDVRYMFYAVHHQHALVNGYSGGAPDDYGLLSETLSDIFVRPDDAWRTIVRSSATHIVVHEAAYLNARGSRVSAILRDRGAHEIAAFDSDRVFAIR